MDSDIDSGSAVRLIGIGSVSGLKSFLGLCEVVNWEGLGDGEEDILSLREKSSGSASGVGRVCGEGCFRGEEGD